MIGTDSVGSKLPVVSGLTVASGGASKWCKWLAVLWSGSLSSDSPEKWNPRSIGRKRTNGVSRSGLSFFYFLVVKSDSRLLDRWWDSIIMRKFTQLCDQFQCP
jgi:hypothetical protein